MTECTDPAGLKDCENSPETPALVVATQTRADAPAAPSPIALPGYEILEEIGRGGMGVVYKARQLKLNRLVALKVVLGGSLAGPRDRERFHMEAEAVARLRHENIVQVYDNGNHGGTEYIAFEYVDGPTVRSWQNQRPIEPETVARIGAAVARGVQHAHDRGIVHRDLKPANILLASAGAPSSDMLRDEPLTVPDARLPVRVPKVMDFGLAKPIDDNRNLTLTGITCGTPNYMAPEQVRGGLESSMPPVDVWGLGAVLFEMLTGRPPFVGSDAASIMQQIRTTEAPSVRKFAPKAPRDMAVIVAKCLEKDPARRYMSPGDLADDLDRFLAVQPILARPISRVQRVRRWVHRNPVAAWVVLGLVCGLCGVSISAVKFNQMAEREHEATVRERAALAKEAQQRQDAEAARDQTRAALKEVERALQEARGERDRAEQNLGLAHQAVRGMLTTITSHSEGEHSALIPVYRELLTNSEPYVARMVSQKASDRDLRFDQALIVRSRGFMEANSGRGPAARDLLLKAADHFRALVKDFPRDDELQRELGATLACLGGVCREVGSADVDAVLGEAATTLQQYLEGHPHDAQAILAMIRVHFACAAAPGKHFCDEHHQAVLGLVERLAALGVPAERVRLLRAHALNNIASDLTNRDKTDEAERYWREVLELRESAVKAQPNDKIARYELAKCLINCSNQLKRTGREELFFEFRQRAAQLFDTLHEDAAFRATYLPVMVDNDFLLASELVRRSQNEEAIHRLSDAIALNSILLARDPAQPRVRGLQADAFTRRAELNDLAERFPQAARDYEHAIEFSTKGSHREYCSAKLVQEHVRAGDWRKARAVAFSLDPRTFSHPVPCLELARAWLMIARVLRENSSFFSFERNPDVEAAVQHAREALLAARERGLFRDPQQADQILGASEFQPLWDLVPRTK
jgi:tetratricopeptide (TPR) repeat protein/tRNA A-37 threonylcarbamoyl transferase component Bud32